MLVKISTVAIVYAGLEVIKKTPLDTRERGWSKYFVEGTIKRVRWFTKAAKGNVGEKNLPIQERRLAKPLVGLL